MHGTTFICGCGHSGTSLLANMFASHPAAYVPLRETNCFLAKGDAARAAWAELRAEAEASGRAFLVEKTPRHIRRVWLIRKLVPGARIIAMVRDGRDVAASFIRRVGSAEVGAKRWMDDNARLRAIAADPDVMTLRYEDLIEDPAAALTAACAFAGMAFAPEMLRYHETERLWFGTGEVRPGTGAKGEEHLHLRNWQINQPLFDGRGAWRGKLDETTLAFFATDPAREMLAHFGYPTACPDA